MSVPRRSLFQRFQDFDIATVFTPKVPPAAARSVYINAPLPDSFYVHKRGKRKVRKDARYATNQVVTSKYTIITFLPRNLLEQFRRIANIFFAFINILQFFPRFSTISPGLVILPLIIVLLITACKDGYEDVKRHQSDRKVNHTRVLVLDGEDHTNPNGMGSKSKTFTRGMRIPFRRKKAAKEEDVEKQSSDQSNGSTAVASGNENGEKKSNPDDELVDVDTPKPHWRSTAWEDVRVGDFVKIRADQPFPGDIIICATSEPENIAYVETKNLDGETNLKSRHNITLLSHLTSAEACVNAGAFRIDADKPETNMYRLNAKITPIDEQGNEIERPEPIDLNTMLLRGTVLRNTDWVIGIVLFTGRDTKIVLNSGGTPSKRGKVERQMNPMVFINLALLTIIAVVCSIADSRLEAYYVPRQAPWTYAEPAHNDNPSFNGFTTFFNALITFQNVVPISLYISIEFVRTCQAAFIYFDGDMYDEKSDSAALSRSWNLSDDLGQVKFMVTDKTGTLTQNSMVFRKCSIGGKIYEGDNAEDETSSGNEVALREKPADGTERASEALGDVEIPLTILSSHGHGEAATNLPPQNTNVPHFHDQELQEDIKNSVSGESASHARALNAFMTTLALCHTAVVGVNDDGSLTYKAQSPDESALVQAAADSGYVFLGKDKDILKLKTPFSEGDSVEEYELLHVLDFTSARKRMSVIVRRVNVPEDAEKRVFLLCKGADSIIIERLKAGQDAFISTTNEHLEYFASSGLRTLCLAYKVIPEKEYEEWSHRYHDATIALDDREELIEQASDEMERGLRLLGATAIEDKLQDGVPETIADLKRAGIKIWVATGDKLETAISIGYSTNLIAVDSNLIVVRGGGDADHPQAVHEQMVKAVESFFPNDGILELEEIHPPVIETSEKPPASPKPGNLRRAPTGLSEILDEDNGRKPGGFILVIDGTALTHAFEENHSKQLLLQIGLRCEAVICCRVSPLQKAQLVHMIKDNLGVMTLAIGDGANDVSMIQAADVGVGISGEEGLQAVNSSDYAIAQFRFIKRLLLVHGHWSYARNANMIGNFFYKNVVIVIVLFWFQIYCAWSTTYVIDYTYLLFWNVFWSLAPVIAIGVFDRNIDGDVLMAIPELYRYGREGAHFGLVMFTWYMLDAVLQSAIVFFLTTYSYALTSARHDGYEIAMYEYSATMILSTVIIVNLFNGLNTTAWTGWVFFAVSLGIVLVWAFTAIYSTIRPGWFVTSSYGNYYLLFHSVDFWFCLVLTIPLALLPRYIDKAVRFMFFPTDFDILRYIKKKHPNQDFAADPSLGGKLKARHMGTQSQLGEDNEDARSMASSLQPPRRSFQSSRPDLRQQDWRSGSRTDMSTGQHMPNRGFNFSQEEGGIAIRRTQTNLSERYLQRIRTGGGGEQQRGNHPYMASAPALPRGETNPRRHSLSLTASLLRRSMRRPKEDES